MISLNFDGRTTVPTYHIRIPSGKQVHPMENLMAIVFQWHRMANGITENVQKKYIQFVPSNKIAIELMRVDGNA